MMTAVSPGELRDALAGIRHLPRSQARIMPPAFYTSPEFLELEKEHVFRREWVCIGHVGEIPNPGDYFVTELIGEPLLVVRDDDGSVRVLSNVCRHRANLLAEGRGNRSVFTCGYHAWTYARDGRLLKAPRMERVEGFDRAGCRLPSFRTEVWESFIFVNLDDKAKPLAPRLEELVPHIRNYHQDERGLLYHTEDVWRTNWKCLTENFIESYHISVTHPQTIHPYMPTEGAQKIPGSEAFTVYKGSYPPSVPQRGTYHPDLTSEERRCSVLYCVFPSFVASYAPDITIYLCLQPKSVDEVAIRWGITGYALDPDAAEVKDYIAFCDNFNAEDRARLEAVQKGLKSRFYTPGPLAPTNYEGTVWDFYQFMASRLASDVSRASRS